MVQKFFLSCLVFGLILSLSSGEPDGTCPEVDPPVGPGVYLPDKDNCAGYYACAGGVPFHMYCAQGTYWDPITEYCEVGPITAHCGSRPTTVASSKI